MAPRRLPCTAANLSSARAAWLAALVDGEGTIHLRSNGGWIAVYNTNKPLLDRCQQITEAGTVRKKHTAKSEFKRLQMWEWVVERDRNVHHILCQLYPYLIIKQHLAVQFIVKWKDNYFTHPPEKTDTPEMAALKKQQMQLSDREFSKQLGISPSFLNKIYHNKSKISKKLRRKINGEDIDSIYPRP